MLRRPQRLPTPRHRTIDSPDAALYSAAMSVDHYENFPVASRLLPREYREAVAIIYRFARRADDIADEGRVSAHDRLAALAAFGLALHRLEAGKSLPDPALPAAAAALKPAKGWMAGPVFPPLARQIVRWQLPIQPFHDLLSAFSQDVRIQRYPDWAALLDYCQRSANPVGRLLLALYQQQSAQQLAQSDAICTGLQLANFIQDLSVDLPRNRLYVPLDELRAAGLGLPAGGPGALAKLQKASAQAWQPLIQQQIDRARALLQAGAPLALSLPGRFGWELRLIVQGGLRILERAERLGPSLVLQRPKLGLSDGLLVAVRAVMMRDCHKAP